MSIQGSCLCGGVRFEFEASDGPFEICHCTRCRKLSGSMGMPALTVSTDGYRLKEGRELFRTYEAPIIYSPPAYHAYFCVRCGSPLPEPEPGGESMEIPAGLIDDDPGIRPDKHIFVEFLPAWDRITDGLPVYSPTELASSRGVKLPEGFTLRSHYDAGPDK